MKKLVILPPDKERKETAIILLTNPADEAQAIERTVKSSKSNTSDRMAPGLPVAARPARGSPTAELPPPRGSAA